MNLRLPFPLPGNRKDSSARRRHKPAAHPPLTLEALEELTAPSAMPGTVRAAVRALVPSKPAITAPLALAVSPAGAALTATGGIPAQITSSHSLQAPLRGTSKVLSTLASDLHQSTGPLSGIAGRILRGTAPQLSRAIREASGQRASLTSSGTAQQVTLLLDSVLTNPNAIPSNLSSSSGSGTANAALGLNTVLTGVTGDLNNAASNLRALSDLIQSGTAATTTGDAMLLLDRAMTDVATSVRAVLGSLTTLVRILPDLLSALSHARQFLQSALTDVTSSLGVIVGSLDTIAVQLPGILGSWPGDGPITGGGDDWSASWPGGPRSFIDGVLTEVCDSLSSIANLLGMLAGSLSCVLAGAPVAVSGPSSSAAGARQLIDAIFTGVASGPD
jgi:hypothetical protein